MAKANEKFSVTIEGIAPLVMHNGQTADPLNAYAKAMKQISGKRKKVDADHENLAKIEWEAALYLDRTKTPPQVNISGHVVEACIIGGAKRSKEGKDAKTALFVDGDAKFLVNGKHVTLDDIKEKEEFRLAAPVKIGTSRIVRTRPKFDKWSATFTIEVLAGVSNAERVKAWVEDAGMFVGLCDWRPRFGRFRLKEFKPM